MSTHLAQTYCPAVRLSHSPMMLLFQLRNCIVVAPRLAASASLIGDKSERLLIVQHSDTTCHVWLPVRRCKMQAAGKHTAEETWQVLLLVMACRSPVATPYLVERESHPDPLLTDCPAHVVAAGADPAVVVGVNVTGGAGSYVATALTVKSRSFVLQISATSWS